MTTAIKLSNLYKRYKKQDGSFVQAVDNLSFAADQGEIIALLGPNGAGKTTTVKMIGGLVLPDSGSVEIAACWTDQVNYSESYDYALIVYNAAKHSQVVNIYQNRNKKKSQTIFWLYSNFIH